MADLKEPLDHRAILGLIAMALAVLVIANDFTALSVALPAIEADFGADVTTVQWVINGYALVFGVLIVTGGRLADMFGRRKVFFIGTAIFSIFSLLGGLASVYHDAGQALAFWSLILPHGVIELPCCFIAGGAGLILGYALVDPGRHERFDWLAHEGRTAAKLVAGVVPMLVIAALVETWVTPSHLPIPVKYLVAAVLLLATVVCLTWPALAQSFERSFRRK